MHQFVVVNFDQHEVQDSVTCEFVDDEERREAASFQRFLQREKAKGQTAAVTDEDSDVDNADVTT